MKFVYYITYGSLSRITARNAVNECPYIVDMGIRVVTRIYIRPFIVIKGRFLFFKEKE